MSAHEQRDILGELFRGDQGMASVPGLEELDALVHSCLPPRPPRPRNEIRLLPLKRRQVSTKKTTHYLREDIFDGLTQAKEILLKMLPNGSKSKASKSNLVNHAVNQLLREIEAKGLESPMLKTILGNIE